MLSHPFEPVFDEHSEILVLGTFPSVKSRENEFYYGHPQNRFWKMLAGVFSAEIPITIREKRNFMLERKIALWDVLASCEIIGSADTSIKNPVLNDLNVVIRHSNVNRILCNGRKAFDLYTRYNNDSIPAVVLPSTSPANAATRLDTLISAWSAAFLG